MSRSQQILQILQNNSIQVVGDLVDDPDMDGGFLAFIRQSADRSGAVQPSKKKLALARDAIGALGASIKMVLHDEKASSVELALQNMLQERYSDRVAGAVTSLEGETAYVWIEERKKLDQNERNEVAADASQLLGFLGATETHVAFSGTPTLPSPSAFLGTVRKHAPLSKEELLARLQELKFDLPTETWLDNALDLCRKRGLLSRRSDGKFVLTLKGLNDLGSRRNRTSPDVSRALAVARKR